LPITQLNGRLYQLKFNKSGIKLSSI